MKKLQLTLLFFITPISVYSKSSLDSLKDYFTIENLTPKEIHFDDDYLNKIPWTLTEKYFQIKLDPNSRRSYSIDFWKKDNFLVFHFAIPGAAGGMCENQYLVTLKPTGEFIDKIEFSHESADYGFSDILYSTYFDTYIQQVRVVKDYDISGSKRRIEAIKESFGLFEMTENGKFKKIAELFPDDRREFKYSSCRLIKESELDSMTSEQLATARNEIFATYGHEFKTKKWKDYFELKSWYKPTKNDITDRLNPIEKKNVELINRKENE